MVGAFLLWAFTLEAAPENPLDPRQLSLWATSANLRGGFGYRDNVLLSSARPQASPFSLVGLELFAYRLPLDGTEVSLLASGEDKRYLDAPDADKEQFLTANASIERQFGGPLAGLVSVQYFYMDQVFDASTTEYDLGVVVARGHGLLGKPGLRTALGARTWLDLEGMVAYQWLDSPLDDYWENGPRLAVRHEYGYRSEIQLSYRLVGRDYATRLQVAANGDPLAGTSLAYQIHRVEVVWRQNLDQRRLWRTTTKLGLELNHDNGSGYFDYTRYFGGLQARYEGAGWEVKGQLDVSHYEYVLQTVAVDDPARRRKTSLAATLSANKKLSRRFSLFAEYEYEQSLANQESDRYNVHTVTAGLDTEF